MAQDDQSTAGIPWLAESLARPSEWDLSAEDLLSVLHVEPTELDTCLAPVLVEPPPPTDIEQYLKRVLETRHNRRSLSDGLRVFPEPLRSLT
jgi:hypothetical protein